MWVQRDQREQWIIWQKIFSLLSDEIQDRKKGDFNYKLTFLFFFFLVSLHCVLVFHVFKTKWVPLSFLIPWLKFCFSQPLLAITHHFRQFLLILILIFCVFLLNLKPKQNITNLSMDLGAYKTPPLILSSFHGHFKFLLFPPLFHSFSLNL